MNPLEYAATNPTYEETKELFWIFGIVAKDDLLQCQVGAGSHHIEPRALVGNAYGVCCDVVTELDEGIFNGLFLSIDQALLDGWQQVSKEAFIELIPEEVL
jgi:hypothetical protein